jgi:hypothetical protein
MCLHAVVCNEVDLTVFADGRDKSSPPGAPARAGVVSHMVPEFVQGWHPGVAELVTIPSTTTCTPLRRLLSALNMVHADLVVVEVNGAELSVLRSVDFGVFGASVVVVGSSESDGHAPKQVRRAHRAMPLSPSSSHVWVHVTSPCTLLHLLHLLLPLLASCVHRTPRPFAS